MKWLDVPPLSPTIQGLHPLVGQTLLRRGITTPQAVRAFLDADSYSPAPPKDLPGLSAAADRIQDAIHRRQPICVWGDFDVDGQTATAILVQTLQALEADITYHIPVRAREGHGINIPYLQEIIGNGTKLILTCDTGITSHEAVEYANSRGAEIVITDHHDLPPELPPATAVTNPKLLPEGHPLATLSGAGVAYKLAEALLHDQRSAVRDPSSLLDLAALGLVADLAVLTGDTRYLVQKGLAALRNTRRLGLQKVMELAELIPANLTEEHIGFAVGPRLNALGRLSDANPAVELLTTSDPTRARVLATQLEGLNTQRRLLCSQVTRAAEAQLRADPSLLAQPVLILAHPSWPAGIIGIVASRLVERYHKPAILLSTQPGEPARGSARSVEGLNITAAIAAQKDLLLNFGGHPMAAGLSLEQEKLPEFRRQLGRNIEIMLGKTASEEPTLIIDNWLDLSAITPELAAVIEQLAPFGPGNEKPILATRSLTLQSVATIGRNKEHLKLTVADESGSVQTVLWWDGSDEILSDSPVSLEAGDKFDLAYTLRANDWRGVRQVQLEFMDLRLIEEKPAAVKAPKIEVVDYRKAEDPYEILKSLPAGTLIWAESEDRKTIGAVDRNGLSSAARLAIWTPPPSPEELHQALNKVQPQTVYLLPVAPPLESPEAFLGQLAGILKYAIGHRGGKTTYSELAAATAQRSITVKRGLDWLVSQGNFNIQKEEGDELIIFIGTSLKDPAGAARLWREVQSLLAEAAAYRAHFTRAEKDALLSY